MNAESYILFISLALVCEVIGTVSGFGSSILFVPVAAMFFDFKTVLGITAVFHVFSNLTKIALFRSGVVKNITIRLGIPAVVFVIAGAWLTTYIPQASLTLVMNVMLAGLALYLLWNANRQLKQTNANLYAGGAVSGLLAGLTGTGGAVRGVVLSAFYLPKDVFIATSAFIDLGVDASRTVVYVLNGYFSAAYLILIPILIGISIAGTYMGKLLLQYTSETLFRKLVLLVVTVTSLFHIIKYLV